ncbi:MAG: hypothetical protein PHO41_09235, partial [Eubacteriales bacterium]|nr:hypothetical protein [Eubacteriales bacterium]
LVDGAVTAPKIGALAVTEAKINTGAVTADKIGTGAVTLTKMAANSVDSDQYVDGSIDTAHFAAGAVDATAIASDAVTTAKILDDNVTTAKIAAGAVTATELGASAVTTAKILAANVTTACIADANVTNAKLANLAQGSIKVGGALNAVTDLVAKTDKYILIGDGTDLTSVPVSGDVTISNLGAVTIANDAVSNAKLANIAQGSVKVGGAANAPNDLNCKTDGYIMIGDGTDIKSVAVSGDVTIVNTGATTIGAGKVLATMLAATSQPLTTAIADPGDAGAIPVTNTGYVPIVQIGEAETRTLAAPTFAGQLLLIDSKTYAADTVITVDHAINAAGNNTITINTEGDYALLVGIEKGAAKVWRVMAYDGAALSTAG